MQTKTHLALGHYLLNQEPDHGLHRHSGLFLIGCMEPDYNLATYLRGLRKHGVFHGHNAENSFTYVSGGLGAFEENGPRSAWDYFRLGALLHYVADAFTGQHNGFWTGNLVGHAVYELKLNDALINELAKAKRHPANESASCPLSGYFAAAHRRYCMEEKGISTDSLYIVRVCSVLLHSILRGSGEFRETKETGVAHGR